MASDRTEKARLKLLARFSKKSKYTAACGDLVFQQLFGMETVRVYAGGYISVGGVFKEPKPEKLIAINFDVSTGKKTGLGRAVGAALTGGLNLLGSGNIRGDVYIAIQTETNNRMVHSQTPTTEEIAELRRLEMITQQMLNSTNNLVTQTETSGSTSQELERLATLFEKGLITKEEYTTAKAKLLGI